MEKDKKDKVQKKKAKEHKVIEKFIQKKKSSKKKYITKGVLKNKVKNSQTFTHVERVEDNGI